MIKVELFYKVSMFGSDWMVSAAEFEEFRKEALNLPLARFETLPRVITREYGDSGLNVEDYPDCIGPLDDAEKCPDYIEPPSVITELSPSVFVEGQGEPAPGKRAPITIEAIAEIKEEKVQEEPKKENVLRDYSDFIDMAKRGHGREDIIKAMRHQWDIARPTAQTYYYKYISKAVAQAEEERQQAAKVQTVEDRAIEVGRAMEKEKKDLLTSLEAKIDTNEKILIIPPVEKSEPEPGKLFSKEFREMIQEKSKGSTWMGNKGVTE